MSKRGRKPMVAPLPPIAEIAVGGKWDTAPTGLDPLAAAAWSECVECLRAGGNLERTDPALVYVYAVNVSILKQAQAKLCELGAIIVDVETCSAKKNPACELINSASMRINAVVGVMGLSPASSKYAARTNSSATIDPKWAGVLG